MKNDQWPTDAWISWMHIRVFCVGTATDPLITRNYDMARDNWLHSSTRFVLLWQPQSLAHSSGVYTHTYTFPYTCNHIDKSLHMTAVNYTKPSAHLLEIQTKVYHIYIQIFLLPCTHMHVFADTVYICIYFILLMPQLHFCRNPHTDMLTNI